MAGPKMLNKRSGRVESRHVKGVRRVLRSFQWNQNDLCLDARSNPLFAMINRSMKGILKSNNYRKDSFSGTISS